MLLRAEELVAGYSFIARRYKRVAHCDPAAVARALVRAGELAGGESLLEPAAVFYALAETRRAFPFAWRLMPTVAADAQAHRNGFSLHFTRAEAETLCDDVLFKRATWETVRAFFAGRVAPPPSNEQA